MRERHVRVTTNLTADEAEALEQAAQQGSRSVARQVAHLVRIGLRLDRPKRAGAAQ